MSKPKFIPKQRRLRAELEEKRELHIPIRDKKHANSIRNSLNYAVNHGMEKYKSAVGEIEGKEVLRVWLIGGGE